MSVFVCGDIHGTLDIDKLDEFVNREDLSSKDYLIILGDTAICGFSKKDDEKTRERLRQLPMTVLFIDGNHENHTALNDYPVDEWKGGLVHIIEPGIIHLMRGQIFEIEDATFLTFGGAFSRDKHLRILGMNYFEEELPSKEEYEEATKNLEQHNNKVNYVLTHTGPYEVISEIGFESHSESLEQVMFFQELAENIEFDDWYFGHLHIDEDLDRFHCRYDIVEQII